MKRNILEPIEIEKAMIVAEICIYGLILVCGLLGFLIIFNPAPPCGTDMPIDHCIPQTHPQNERWDQGYLNEHSARRPCPAVYDAPNGELQECL